MNQDDETVTMGNSIQMVSKGETHRLTTTTTNNTTKITSNTTTKATNNTITNTKEEEVPTYHDDSANDLTLYSGALLLMADCLGTGILALPHDLHVLGPMIGISFIILNLPINWYAGTILAHVAKYVEVRDYDHIRSTEDDDDDDVDFENVNIEKIKSEPSTQIDRSTFDFIGLTNALFLTNTSSTNTFSYASAIVTTTFYINIFLVLGNYILVMSHAVRAFLGESNICLPTAGIVASTLMFGLAQMRTMAKLGRWATIMSLSALLIVVLQCLYEAQYHDIPYTPREIHDMEGVLRQFASLSSIGFAIGSQKLFLNIRHEMKDRDQATSSLGICLFSFGSAYVAVCLLAGTYPPGFLFDAIPTTSFWNRRIAGFFLWLHVAVSYAINSQAINSSIDRVYFHRVKQFQLSQKPKTRWFLLTLLTSISSYLVANAVPFFKDLVSLIGALTSVPLTLLLPAILYRKGSLQTRLWMVQQWSDINDVGSFLLILFSLAFMVCGLLGAILSIQMDWAHHGPPFACEG